MKKKILASIAAGLVIFGGVLTPVFGFFFTQFQTPVAEAECTLQPCPPEPEIGPQQPTPTTGGSNGFSPVQPPGTFSGGSAADVGLENNDGGQNIGTPNPCSGGDWSCSLMVGISEVIMFVPTSIATIAGMVFDYSIWNSIQSGTYTKYDGADGNDGLVVSGWKLVRDFTNLLFIFALFVIAFTLILDLDGGATVTMTSNPKRTLARVLMMALLVNFSFFLSRGVIDITNKFSLQFYTNMSKAPKITATDDPSQKEVNTFYSSPGNESIHSIATGIIGKINPQKFYLDPAGANAKPGVGNYGRLFMFSIVSAIFGLFLAYIFFSIAILFIGRTIGLYLAVIISPLAFVSYTVPFLQKQPYIGFDDWMKQFMGLAFMAPIFLFFVYIAIQFFDIPMASGGGSLALAAQIIFKFAIVAMFFTLAKQISKDMSGKIGDIATSFVTGAATSAVVIGAAAATGGGSAAWMATKRQAASNLDGASRKILGDEKTDAIRSRMGGLKNFRTFGNNPGAALAGLGGMVTGSKVPGQIYGAGQEGARIGRVKNFGNLREEVKARQEAEAKKKSALPKTGFDEKYENLKNDPQAKARLDYLAEFDKTADGKRMQELVTKAANTKDPVEKAQLNKEYDNLRGKRDAGMKSATEKPATTAVATNKPAPGGPEAPMKATNTFTGDGKFDRPVEKPSGLVDVNGQPMSKESLDANQKLESARLARLYENAEREKKNTVHVDNLEVKNLKVNPTETRLPSRNSNGSMTPQKQATTLLSGIQMTPRASSGALNYKPSDLSTKPAESVTKPIGLLDSNGNPVNNQPSDAPTPKIVNAQGNSMSQADREARTKRIQDSMEKTIMSIPENEVWGNDDAGNPITDYDDWKHFQLTGENRSLPKQ